MIHAAGYLGRYEPNFYDLRPGMTHYVRDDGSKGEVDQPPIKLDGIFFGYMENPGKNFVGVRARFRDFDICLDEPVSIEPRRHTDGKGFGPRPSQFGDDSARNLLNDMIKMNPSKSKELESLGRAVGVLI